ncbi:hypothetical protein EG831_02130 [bacterium]|nr:hypothetical protein [bacterium]
MKKVSQALVILAGVCLLAAVLYKLGALPHNFLGTVPSSWLQLAQTLFLGAIAVKCFRRCCCKDGHKDGEQKGEPCCK